MRAGCPCSVSCDRKPQALSVQLGDTRILTARQFLEALAGVEPALQWSRLLFARQLLFLYTTKRASTTHHSLQLAVFGSSLLQNGNVPVRIFPESQEILIGGFCFGLIT